MRPPHGNPGSWTAQVINKIFREFKVSVDTLPEQLIIQLGVCEKCWPYIQKTRRSYCRFEPTKKNAWKNRFGILFLFEPRRQLPGNHRSQSISPFFWAHNTNIQVWIPPMGFYCRGSLVSQEAAVKAAAQLAGVHSNRPICMGEQRDPLLHSARWHVCRHCCFPLL